MIIDELSVGWQYLFTSLLLLLYYIDIIVHHKHPVHQHPKILILANNPILQQNQHLLDKNFAHTLG